REAARRLHDAGCGHVAGHRSALERDAGWGSGRHRRSGGDTAQDVAHGVGRRGGAERRRARRCARPPVVGGPRGQPPPPGRGTTDRCTRRPHPRPPAVQRAQRPRRAQALRQGAEARAEQRRGAHLPRLAALPGQPRGLHRSGAAIARPGRRRRPRLSRRPFLPRLGVASRQARRDRGGTRVPHVPRVQPAAGVPSARGARAEPRALRHRPSPGRDHLPVNLTEPVTVRLGGGQGFYGDGLAPVADLLEAGVDYLVCEALAELTLAILLKDRQRDESLGFTRDLPLYLQAALPFVLDGRTRFITNAGGINPIAAGRAVKAAASALGVSGFKVATVVGDDVRPQASALGLPDDALFANAYLGARPIVDALDAGAHVVITGRVADAALFLAPLVHELGWRWDDWDRLAAGVVVGHLLECSGQVTGGNYSGAWWENPAPARIAFPIAEVEGDGTAVITKPSTAGGMVTFDTVREQLLYEVHDPARYASPDVVADFTSLRLEDLGDDRVRVGGTRAASPPATDTYKGLVCTTPGWAGAARLADP